MVSTQCGIMRETTIVFTISALVGVSMILKPDFVLFKPVRYGRLIAGMIGENNWLVFIRMVGILLAAFSIFFLIVDYINGQI